MIVIAENITDISYLMILDKVYTVTSISFADMTITAEDEGINKKDIPECEIFGIEDIEEFSIKLVNRITPAEIIDFLEWKSKKLSNETRISAKS